MQNQTLNSQWTKDISKVSLFKPPTQNTVSEQRHICSWIQEWADLILFCSALPTPNKQKAEKDSQTCDSPRLSMIVNMNQISWICVWRICERLIRHKNHNIKSSTIELIEEQQESNMHIILNVMNLMKKKSAIQQLAKDNGERQKNMNF